MGQILTSFRWGPGPPGALAAPLGSGLGIVLGLWLGSELGCGRGSTGGQGPEVATCLYAKGAGFPLPVRLKSEIHEIHRPSMKSTSVQPKLISKIHLLSRNPLPKMRHPLKQSIIVTR